MSHLSKHKNVESMTNEGIPSDIWTDFLENNPEKMSYS